MVRTTIDDASCPACSKRGLEYTAEQIELPYLGESLETMLRCTDCGYRHVDFVLTRTSDPARYKYAIQTEDDMMVRVVRSSSGTIRIPELGIDIEPGAASDAYITNIEGIIVRVERILSQLHHDAQDEGMKEKVEEMQHKLLDLRIGKGPKATLVLEDPFGNSGIISEDTIIEIIPADEAARLKTGTFVIDQ